MHDVSQLPTTNKTKARRRTQTTKEIRQAHIEKWRASGLKMTDYCKQEGLPLSSFSAWVKICTVSNPIFKPVVMAGKRETSRGGCVVEILAGDRLKVRVLDVKDSHLAVSIIKGIMACN